MLDPTQILKHTHIDKDEEWVTTIFNAYYKDENKSLESMNIDKDEDHVNWFGHIEENPCVGVWRDHDYYIRGGT